MTQPRDAAYLRREAARLPERTAKAAARLRPGMRCTVSLGDGAYLTTDVAAHPYLERGCWWVRVAGVPEAQPCTRVRPVEAMQRCSECHGSGVNNRDHDLPPVQCRACGGSGSVQICARLNANLNL